MTASQPTAEILDRVADLLQARIGLRPDPFLRSRLGRCIRDEREVHGLATEAYLQALAVSDSVLQSLLDRVTVQETGFFRHPEHFEVLARELLATLPQPIRIWSAGCANGQEAFSLAMLLDEQRIDGAVIATDLSTKALERTSAARYAARELTGLSPERVARHLVHRGRTWEINPSVRNRVSTLRHNLMSPLPEQVRSCHVVFCRNVLIYFSPEHTKAFLDRVADTLPAAWLFLGAAETMWTVSERYETVRIGEAYAYRPRVAGVTAAKPPVQRVPASVPEVRRALPRPARSEARGYPGVGAPEAESVVTLLARTGQQALSEGDHAGAIVAFRKWVYLAQDDAVAHLHLGLALEAAGDPPSAHRAFGAARRVLEADPERVEQAIGGYAPAELLRLLDAKHEVTTR